MDNEQSLALLLVLLLCLSLVYEFLRGRLLYQRSGFRFYRLAALVNFLALALPLAIFATLTVLQAEHHWRWFVAGMLALALLSAADWLQRRGEARARRMHPDRWSQWQQDVGKMRFFDRLLLRYPFENNASNQH